MLYTRLYPKIWLSLTLAACAAQAEICSVATIGGLVGEADAIVVGRVATVSNAAEGKFLQAVLVASDVIDGSLPAVPIPFLIPIRYEFDTGQELVGRRVLVFLSGMSGGAPMEAIPWSRCGGGPSQAREAVRIYPADAGPLLAADNRDSPMQKLIKELAVLAQANPSAYPITSSLIELARGHVEVATLHQVFRLLMENQDPALSGLGLLGMAHTGDLVGLQAIDGVLRTDRTIDRQQVFQAIERGFIDSTPEAVALLRRWLAPQQPTDQRIAAAGALHRLQTAASTIVLGEALADADLEVRWRAIQGLIPFANFGPEGRDNPRADWPLRSHQTHLNSISTPRLYAENEQPWLDFWRSWWRENEAAVRAMAAEARAVRR